MDRFFFCRFLRFSKSIFRHLWNGFGPSFCFVISEVLSNSWRESAILSDAWDNWIGASGPRGNWMFPSHFKWLSMSGRDSRGCLRYFQGFLGTKELFLEKKTCQFISRAAEPLEIVSMLQKNFGDSWGCQGCSQGFYGIFLWLYFSILRHLQIL